MGFCGWVGVEFRKGTKSWPGSALRLVLHEDDMSYTTENGFWEAMLLLLCTP